MDGLVGLEAKAGLEEGKLVVIWEAVELVEVVWVLVGSEGLMAGVGKGEEKLEVGVMEVVGEEGLEDLVEMEAIWVAVERPVAKVGQLEHTVR
jgi:hypothetical protein